MTLYLYRKCRQAVTLTSPSPKHRPMGAPLSVALGQRAPIGALVALILALQMHVVAQWRAPRPERTTARAIGVLEIYPDGSRRLVPVSLYYERRYYDAGLYRATPVPFTISPATVYEVQRLGKPLGTFTVRSAGTDPGGAWVGTGIFRTSPNPATLAKAKKTAAPVAVEDPTRPVLHRREGSQGDRPVAKKPTAAPDETEDAERPKLHRKKDAAESSSEKTNRTVADAGTASAEAPPESSTDRPILRRGKPAQGSPGEPAGGLAGQKEQGGGDLPSQSGAASERKPEPVQRQVAVSDAGPSQPQELLFDLPEPRRSQVESAARELARSELLRLAPMRGLSAPGAASKPPAPSPSSPKSATPAAGAQDLKFQDWKFEDEQFVPYDLDYKDYATVVFSARYRPSASGGTAGAMERGWVVTIIARQDGDKLVKLYSAVSNPRELDLYPELRLVDAVDPEGYGRFALLFREQKRDGASWLLGRVSGYELQTVFETAAR